MLPTTLTVSHCGEFSARIGIYSRGLAMRCGGSASGMNDGGFRVYGVARQRKLEKGLIGPNDRKPPWSPMVPRGIVPVLERPRIGSGRLQWARSGGDLPGGEGAFVQSKCRSGHSHVHGAAAARNASRHVRNEIRQIRDRASSVSIAAGCARLIRPAARQTPRGVCGIGVAIHPARMRTAAFYANEDLDGDIEDRIVWFNPFEPEFAVAELAVQGRRRLDEVTHMQPPFVRRPS